AADFANVGIWSGRTEVTDGAWHRVAWVYSDTARSLRFYVDGREDGVVSVKGIPDIEGDILRIGMAAPQITSPNGFVGDIDDVRLYAGALSAERIAAGDAPDPVAHWPLDGDGRDVAGGRYTGVVVDASESADGAVAQCLRFGGVSAIEVTDPYARLLAQVRMVNPVALRDAIAAMGRAGRAASRLREAERFAARYSAIVEGLRDGDPAAAADARALLAFQREALLADASLDFDRILLVRRSMANPGLPENWTSNSDLPRTGYDNEVAVMSDWRTKPQLTTHFRPPAGRFIGDVDLHFDASRMLVSMPGDNGRWQVHEIGMEGAGPAVRQLDLISEPDVDNYDACYLPDGAIIFSSTAPFVGVPCVTGSSHVSNLYRRELDGTIRRLTFEQDHDWCPTVMNDGRVLYLRWEYSDLPHFVSRILFTMNPDGTNQMAHYGSNSYWPNSMFCARPVPGDSTKFVAIVSGHHDTTRMGELVLFDAARGSHEADGVVQRIPGLGRKVEPVILDGLVKDKWPKFLHPWPLDANRCLVSAQLTPGGRWGLYLADTFDNLVLIHDLPGSALFEPIPLKRRPVPPVIAGRVKPNERDAVISLTDVYAGPGLAGTPRGTVKSLRVFTYQFAYHGVGGQVHRVGLDGPWDVRRIIGTVPVHADGSASFRAPANTPISLQPLDADGRALQLMRSWMTAMPGERLACAGCHEPTNSSSANRNTIANRRPPDPIRPWYGPARGFSFRREVQPVLDAHCVRCHGEGGKPDLRDRPDIKPSGTAASYNDGSHFPPSYLALRSYVRGHTIESDMHLLTPGEFHASTTHLVRMLEKGHHGARLDREAWDRINTWIDLNTPAHGTWGEIVGPDYVAHQRKRRMEMDRRYAGLNVDGEAQVAGRPYRPSVSSRATDPLLAPASHPQPSSHPSQRSHPSHRGSDLSPTRSAGVPPARFDLGGGVVIEMARIPAGSFVMGDPSGHPDERPCATVRIERPFLMGRFEVTNAQYRRFDRMHDSRLEVGDFLQFSVEERGYPVNGADQPVCRVSWERASAFCEWLSRRTGRRFALPTEAQWEYACRSGTSTPMSYGAVTADFGRLANLADASLRHVDTFAPWGLPSGAIQPWRRAIESVNDGRRVSAPVGSYAPNAWGLHDMHGNVAEWTRSALVPYPYRPTASASAGPRVVRGGSWYDLPQMARSAYRGAYPPWRRVFDVGFRVVCETP
ncbi:MAG: hypothetical protein FJX72_00950, partial [Armatimonadetes bacterium]|nr:hypothetical protein [Armatimonadota bacterium]